MRSVLSCISDNHDQQLLVVAAVVCTIGVFGTSAIAGHAGRQEGRARLGWAVTSIVAAGCTAWATHMIGLLAFVPGMPAAFDPLLSAVSLATAILGIGAGVALAIGRRERIRRFLAGLVLGLGVGALHYLGQASYVVTGRVEWNASLVGLSLVASLIMFGAAMVAARERDRLVRACGAPLFLVAIAVLHFYGMTAATLVFDPTRALPTRALAPGVIAPFVAGISLALLALAILGLRFTIAAKAAARRDRERLRELASFAVEGLAICDGDIIATANQSLEELVGVAKGDLSGCSIAMLLPGIPLSDLPEREERDAELRAADGYAVPVRVLRRPIVLGGKHQAVVAVRDQRERLRTETKIRTLAFSDALTGLPNRARFNDLLAAQTVLGQIGDARFAVLLIDLDRFKLVNDTLGHAAGDALLQTVAERLKAVVTERDVVARLGGDEFAIIHPAIAADWDPAVLADRVVELLRQPFAIEGQNISVGASVGFTAAPDDADTPETLLRNADLALYKAKADGKGVFRPYEPELSRRAQERRDMEADLRRALEVGEFEVHYQPLLNVEAGRVSGAEALVRWRHPARGLVPPGEFISLAEENGLIGALGRWVLRAACTEAAAWPSHIKLAVNLSPAQFCDPRLVETVVEALADAALAPERLELEITEGVLLFDEDQTSAALNRLRDLGIGLSMDDFGTGYSSLSYLRRYPFTKIKIDRSFVGQLPADPESAAIVRAIVSLGRCLGMATLVEGVETAEQLAFATAEGLDQVQGYFVSRPVPADEFLTFVEHPRAAA